MKRVCAWCTQEMPMGGSEREDDDDITHGICPDCESFVCTNTPAQTVREFLNGFEVPVLAIAPSRRVHTANNAALSMLGKSIDEVDGELGGDAMECAYAKHPAGCGETAHCEACTIRTTVMETHETGQPRRMVTAYQDIDTPDGTANMRFVISTQRVNDIVVLSIHEAADATA